MQPWLAGWPIRCSSGGVHHQADPRGVRLARAGVPALAGGLPAEIPHPHPLGAEAADAVLVQRSFGAESENGGRDMEHAARGDVVVEAAHRAGGHVHAAEDAPLLLRRGDDEGELLDARVAVHHDEQLRVVDNHAGGGDLGPGERDQAGVGRGVAGDEVRHFMREGFLEPQALDGFLHLRQRHGGSWRRHGGGSQGAGRGRKCCRGMGGFHRHRRSSEQGEQTEGETTGCRHAGSVAVSLRLARCYSDNGTVRRVTVARRTQLLTTRGMVAGDQGRAFRGGVRRVAESSALQSIQGLPYSAQAWRHATGRGGRTGDAAR